MYYICKMKVVFVCYFVEGEGREELSITGGGRKEDMIQAKIATAATGTTIALVIEMSTDHRPPHQSYMY